MLEFNYKEYIRIIENLMKAHTIYKFEDIHSRQERFAVIRHDVEFSVERAYLLACVEEKIGVKSNYFFQLRNNSYNLASQKNISLVKKIIKLGHTVGLHVNLDSLENLEHIKDYIKKEILVLEYLLGVSINTYSYHRPSSEVLKLNLQINGLINTYDSQFFEYRDRDDDLLDLKVKYYSDSMHSWNYGYPTEEGFNKYQKIQLLTHPFSWTNKGYEYNENIESLIAEKTKVLKQTIKYEMTKND